jgi:hypothetical protein
MSVLPEAVELWRHIRAIQRRSNPSETHLLELRAALNELGHVLGYDGILIEPHRIARDGRPWPWIHAADQVARWQLAKRPSRRARRRARRPLGFAVP